MQTGGTGAEIERALLSAPCLMTSEPVAVEGMAAAVAAAEILPEMTALASRRGTAVAVTVAAEAEIGKRGTEIVAALDETTMIAEEIGGEMPKRRAETTGGSTSAVGAAAAAAAAGAVIDQTRADIDRIAAGMTILTAIDDVTAAAAGTGTHTGVMIRLGTDSSHAARIVNHPLVANDHPPVVTGTAVTIVRAGI